MVPAHIEPPKPEDLKEFDHTPELTAELREVVEADIFLTGDANLLIESEVKRDANRLTSGSLTVLVHVGLIIFLIFIPKIFPAHVPTQQEIDRARQQLTYVLPEEPPEPARPPSPKLRITPKTLNRVAPPVEQPAPVPAPAPAPAPSKPAVELPEAPRPQRVVPPVPTPTPQQSQLEPIPPIPRTPNQLNLHLPSATPGQEIQNQLQDAIKRGASGGIQVPDTGGLPRGGGGGPGMQSGVEILTDTQGVDFNSYIQRLLATLKRNWEAVMPESAQLGDKGMVFTTFQVNHDGSVPSPDPQLERTSGKEPLDNAAMSAIHASNPFEPLPSQFKGQFIRLRIVFLYNLPLDAAK